MSLQFSAQLSLQDEKIQKFLFDEQETTMKIEPTLTNDYYYPTKTNDLDYHIKYHLHGENKLTVPIQVFENWLVNRRTSPWTTTKTQPDRSDILIGKQQVTVIKELTIAINVSYYLSLKNGIKQTDVQNDLDKLKDFTPTDDISSFDQYIADNLTTLTSNDFILSTCIIIEKRSSTALQDIHTEQRDELKRTYEKIDNNGKIPAIDNEITLAKKSKDEDIFLWLGNSELKTKDIINPLPTADYEVKDSNHFPDEPNLTDVMKDTLGIIFDALYPLNCGEMERKERQLFTLLSWPEFKLDFKNITVKM
jgi:hypothetical protein